MLRASAERILGVVADLEEHALRRDRRFLFRFVLIMAITVVAGLWAVSHLTSDSFAGCVARTFGGAPAAGESADAGP